ncbi:MAG: hypothetical protein IH949_10465 [Bacteroidetes bacterium]|nr:hypothetical protein [Bacteroidota bacterium]
MNTFYQVLILVIVGVAARIFLPIILTVVSLPGRFVAFPENPKLHSKSRFTIGFIISIFFQAYLYLAYTAFIVSWTTLAISAKGANVFIWIVSFIVAIYPIYYFFKGNKLNVKETEDGTKEMSEKTKEIIGGPEIKMLSMLVHVSFVTLMLALTSFFIFSTNPVIMKTIFSWVPSV